MDRDVTRVLIASSAVEMAAWGVAWMMDFQTIALAGAIAVSMGIAAIIVVLVLRRAPKR
jgi:hypothetical protein